MKLTPQSPIGHLVANPDGQSLLAEFVPGGLRPQLVQMGLPIALVARMEPDLASDPVRAAEFLARVQAIDAPERRAEPIIRVDAAYDAGAELASSPWRVTTAHPVNRRPVEVELSGPSHGNPFVDVELTAQVEGPTGAFEVTGFYDGDGLHLFRFLPDAAGVWTFTTRSNAQSLDGVAGRIDVEAAPAEAHGPVRVEGFGFRHADGTRNLPLGTTAYAWTHQSEELEEATLATLAKSPFTKLRMCVFPKSYLFNTNEPRWHAFERHEDGSFDTQRFVPEFFRHLEQRVTDLDALGIQADIILFHPYDRWGYADLGPTADDRYLRYVVARLWALPNVWWSMANEYDLIGTKTLEDWDRLAGIVQAHDPVGHLIGNHNCLAFFDNSREWVTHSSIQRIDVYRTAENVDEWRREWGKPVVVDECAYEGDIDQGWGNITGEEMTRRFWEAAVRGGWCGHGETFWAADEVLWWSKGGVLKGESPSRIAFLRQVLEEAPGDLEPSTSDWDAPTAAVGDAYRLTYFSFMRPRYRTIVLPPGTRWHADILDTWEMTVTPVDDVLEGVTKIDLPGRPYIAVRLTRI